jgi:hypothetical protein
VDLTMQTLCTGSITIFLQVGTGNYPPLNLNNILHQNIEIHDTGRKVTRNYNRAKIGTLLFVKETCSLREPHPHRPRE